MPNGGYCGLDLDDCLLDVFDEDSWAPWAVPIIERLNATGTYYERSPSFTGIKAWFLGELPTRLRKVKMRVDDGGMIELYGRSHHFFTWTGCQCPNAGDEVADGTAFLDWITDTYFPEPVSVPITKSIGASLMGQDRLAAYADTFDVPAPGLRNDSAFRYAGHLFSFIDDFGNAPSEDRVIELMRGWNAKMSDPLDDHELLQCIASSSRNGTPRESKATKTSIVVTSELSYSELLGGPPITPSPEVIAASEPYERPVLPPVVSDFPFELLQAPGFIAEFCHLIKETSFFYQPQFALTAAICWLGALCGRKVRTEFNGRTNLYAINLGPPGCGKDHARKVIEHLNTLSGCDLVGPENIQSGQGLISSVVVRPTQIMLLDEIGELFSCANSKESWQRQIATNMMTLYSTAGSVYRGAAVADAKRVHVIKQPHFCFMGTSTVDIFWQSLRAKNVAEGLVPRILIAEGYPVLYEPDAKPLHLVPADSAIVKECCWWREHGGSGELLEDVEPSPRTVEYSREARDRINKHAIITSDKRLRDSDLDGAIWARVAERSAKLALIFSCSRARGDRIEIEDVNRAIKLSNFLARLIIKRSKLKMGGENQVEDNHRRVLSIIDAAGTSGISRTDLCRKTQFLRARDRTEIMELLVGTNQVESMESVATERRSADGSSRGTSTQSFYRVAKIKPKTKSDD